VEALEVEVVVLQTTPQTHLVVVVAAVQIILDSHLQAAVAVENIMETEVMVLEGDLVVEMLEHHQGHQEEQTLAVAAEDLEDLEQHMAAGLVDLAL
jgi:hypothetical protein